MRATGEFVRALNAELEKQAALAMARAVAPAEADAQTANIAERTAKRASAVREVTIAKQR